jgi:hypothetical protein
VLSEIEKLSGDKNLGFDCHIKLTQSFQSQVGKCQFESAKFLTYDQEDNVNTIAACQEFCGVTCSGYQYHAATKVCLTFTEQSTMTGDGTAGYECMIQEVNEVSDYVLRAGSCTMR